MAAVCAAAWLVSASETTSSMAVTAANAWASSNSKAFAVSGSVTEAVAERDADGALLWWVVPFSGGGAVIVAPDTRIEPVVAVLPSYDGSLPSNHPLRAILTLDICNRLAHVTNVVESSSSRVLLRSSGSSSATSSDDSVSRSASAAKAKWADLVPSGPVRLRANPSDYVTPIAGGGYPAYVLGICPGFELDGVYTHWAQRESPYSAEYPYYLGGGTCYNLYAVRNAVCGCVATAGAAMLQYFDVTGPTYNATNTCSWGNLMSSQGYYIDLTMIGATNSYDWSILPKSMGGLGSFSNGYLTRDQVELLGRVTYDVDVGVGMAFAEDNIGKASGALVVSLADAFRSYFGFQDARATALPDPFEADEFFEAASPQYEEMFGEFNRKFIYAQLRNKAPVALGILKKGASAGHAVVATGYGLDDAGTGYTRIFMGWAGSSDAWYALPEISTYNIVSQISTMFGKDDRKTVPLYGRVTNSNGVGAAFCEIDVGGVTNAYTDANGYWSVRIDESGLTMGSSTNIFSSSITNYCDSSDTAGLEAITKAIDAFQERLVLMGMVDCTVLTNTYESVIDGVTNYNACVITEEVFSDTSGDQTFIVTNITAHVLPYDLSVTCMATGDSVPAVVGALAFDTGTPFFDPYAMAYSLPDTIDFVVPEDAALVAYSTPTDPDEVAAEAKAAGKMLFMISGDPSTDEYKTILSYLNDNRDTFMTSYVLYLVDSVADPYNLTDANPSFGVFDPNYFNSQAANRWAYYNGRLAYFNATDGVTDEDIQNVLEQSAIRYPKLHSGIEVTINAVGDPESLWGEGIADDTEGFCSDATNWLDEAVAGLGCHTNAFTNGQVVVVTPPSVVTNGNVVWIPTGWRLLDTDEIDAGRFVNPYYTWNTYRSYWEAIQDPDTWAEIFGDMPIPPARFDVDWFWDDSWGDVPMWETNTADNATCATFTVTNSMRRTFYWIFEPTNIYITVQAVNGSVTPESGWYDYSTNTADAVEFTASSDVAGVTFAGWEESTYGAYAGNPISLLPTYPYMLTAVYSLDTTTHPFYISADPADVSAETVVTYNGEPLAYSQGRFVKKPGVVELTAPEVVTNIVTIDDVETTNVLYCVGWCGTGCVPERGYDNVCSCVFTNDSSITWLWREDGKNPYVDSAISFTVAAGEGAPDGASSPLAGTYDNIYTNGQTIVCTAAPGVTNETEQYAVVCSGWTLSNSVTGVELASGEGGTAEITFEAGTTNVLTWSWQTNELVRIEVNCENDGTTTSVTNALLVKGDVIEVTVTAKNMYVLDCWDGDTNDCVFAGYSAGTGYTATIPADSNRAIVAVMTKSSGSARLTVCSVCTNDDGVAAVEWGTLTPAFTTSVLSTGGEMAFSMSGEYVTNVVENVTNVWDCSGWVLYDVTTNLLMDSSHVLAEGSGVNASFTFTQMSTLIWKWTEVKTGRSPLPDTLEGPDGDPALVVNSTSAVMQVANSAAGWWYALYSKTNLVDSTEEWTYVPDTAVLATEDNQLIEAEIIWDPLELVKFFKIMVTEEDPGE